MLNPADPDFVAHLSALLPEGAVRAAVAADLEDPRGRAAGVAGCVVRPGSVEEVVAVVRACAAARVGIVPRAGGTGLVGGGMMPSGGVAPVVLSLERMARLRAVLPGENVIVAEAGAILSDVQAAAAAVGRLFPLSLASEGSARIGGLLGTNAGGVNVLRWGNMRDLCLGIEAVMADGTVIRDLKRLRKDNTGYDLRHLLIGAEGTLGLITAASLRLVPRPAGQGTAWLAVPSPAAALGVLAIAGEVAGDGLSAFELVKGTGLRFLAEAGFDLRVPLDPVPDWSVLIDLGLAAGQDPAASLEAIFAAALDAGLATDGVVAASGAQRAALWALRETIPLANRRIGSVLSNDIAVPVGAIPEFLDRGDRAVAAIAPDLRVNAFGHLGDGNLHYNIFPPAGHAAAAFAPLRDRLEDAVNDLVQALGGTFSAEHGIGRVKAGELARRGDPGKLAAMRAIKAALDPLGILNPGAVLLSGG
ncbi:MAG: FAD-binding oxidoreductase [Rhodobacteraceae bacterium]|jgi:FAD/FMN-containing dehydrogenase|nr:FAD-binding oxidoreductase [Paracoccaceae bacterium]